MAPLNLYLSFLLLLLLASSPLPALSGQCNKDDRKALVAINTHFGFPYLFKSWINDIPCCNWNGVRCDAHGRVYSLFVRIDNLSSTLPPAIGDLPLLKYLSFHKLPNLVGSIPSTITKLTHLSSLDLTRNSLSGPIPPFLSQLTSLIALSLSFNKFSGSIPPSLANLHNLEGLFLDRNQLTGPIPDSFGSFPVNSPPDLYLSHNNLSGDIPSTLGGLQWGVIDLSRNKLTGDASILFGSSKEWAQVDISRNQFAFNFTNSKFSVSMILLDINHNMIYGEIPAQINELVLLYRLNVTYNRLCGVIPAGSVTSKFAENSYFHNKCLCGAPLPPCK